MRSRVRGCHFFSLIFPLAVAVWLGALAVAAPAAQDDDQYTPPRLSFIDGEVTFWRPGAEDWTEARLNTPLAPGDALYVGNGANVEVQFAPHAFARAGSGTELGIESVERLFTQFRVRAGHAAFDVRFLPRGFTIEVGTPAGALTIEEAGYYRIDVDDNRTAIVVRRGGSATLVTKDGEIVRVGSNEEVVLAGSQPPDRRVAGRMDGWDEWNYARTARIVDYERRRYLPADIYGEEDLDRYGSWRLVPRYGRIWVPAGVAVGWVPYSTGRWIYDPFYSWTWIDDAPWGWAPYHYGRWVYVDGYWGWAPGPVVVGAVYAPALVAFFDVSTSVGIRVGLRLPGVAWVALGWGEPCLPWWGAHVGYAWWGGWGGPRFVNNIVVHHHHVIHAREIHYWEHIHHHHHHHSPVVVAEVDNFANQRVGARVLEQRTARSLRALSGSLPVQATSRSLAPGSIRKLRPPTEIENRIVVTTRPARDPAPRLEKARVSMSQHAGKEIPRVVVSPSGKRVDRADAEARLRKPLVEPRKEHERGTLESPLTRPSAPLERAKRQGQEPERPDVVPRSYESESASRRPLTRDDLARPREIDRSKRERGETSSGMRPEPPPREPSAGQSYDRDRELERPEPRGKSRAYNYRDSGAEYRHPAEPKEPVPPRPPLARPHDSKPSRMRERPETRLEAQEPPRFEPRSSPARQPRSESSGRYQRKERVEGREPRERAYGGDAAPPAFARPEPPRERPVARERKVRDFGESSAVPRSYESEVKQRGMTDRPRSFSDAPGRAFHPRAKGD